MRLAPLSIYRSVQARLKAIRALSRSASDESCRRSLYWHLGMGRTGTSHLQRFLSINQTALYKEFNIHYPPPLQVDEVPRSGNAAEIASGLANAAKGEEARLVINALARRSSPKPEAELLLSSEYLYSHVLMREPEKLEPLIEASRKMSFAPQFVLFVRDPVDHLVSAWMQHAKAKVPTASLSSVADMNVNSYGRLAALLEYVEESGLTRYFHIANYSRVKRDVVSTFFEMIGLDANLVEARLQPIEDARTNRSLTPFELSVLKIIAEKEGVPQARRVGQCWGRMDRGVVTGMLTDRDIESLHQFVNNVAPDVEKVNGHLEAASELRVDVSEVVGRYQGPEKYELSAIEELLAHYVGAVLS